MHTACIKTESLHSKLWSEAHALTIYTYGCLKQVLSIPITSLPMKMSEQRRWIWAQDFKLQWLLIWQQDDHFQAIDPVPGHVQGTCVNHPKYSSERVLAM